MQWNIKLNSLRKILQTGIWALRSGLDFFIMRVCRTVCPMKNQHGSIHNVFFQMKCVMKHEIGSSEEKGLMVR
jgi:hypothetical protein